MKWAITIILFLLVMSPFASAQITVTGTVTDADGIAWASLNGYNATFTIQLIDSSGNNVRLGQAYRTDDNTMVPAVSFSGNMDSTGSLSVVLTNNSVITPAGTSWNFRVCPAVNPLSYCFATALVLNSSGSISSQLSSKTVVPRIGGGLGNYAYADVEVAAIANSSYLNITSNTLRCFTTAWGGCGGGGSQVYPPPGVPLSSGSAWGASYAVGTGVNDLVQLNGSGQLPAVSAALLNNFPPLNQNTTGTAAGLSGTPALPNGTTATTQSNGDNSTKVATTAYVAANGAPPFITVLAPSGDTTGGTDGAAIQTACGVSPSVQLKAGNYYIGKSNATVTISSPCRIVGIGPATIINNVGTTNNWFAFTYYTTWNESTWVYPPSTNQSELAWMQFAQTGTPTAGYIVSIGSGISQSGGVYSYTMNVHVHDTIANNAWGGAAFVSDELYASVDNNMWRNFVGGGCINYNAEVGSGDNHFGPNLECSGLAHSGIIIAQSDVQHFLGVKLNGSGIQFTGAGATKSVIFDDMSVETGISQPCMIDFGTGTAPVNIQFNNSEQYGFAQAVCHPTNVTGFAFAFNNSSTTSDYAAGLITNNGYATVAFPPGYQDLATFVGSSATPLNSYTTQAGKTFAQYTADGVTPQAMPVLNGSGQEMITASATDYGDVLDTLTPSSANYTVGETFTLTNTTDQVAIFARASNSANTNYVFGYGGAGFVFLYSQVAGTATLLTDPAFSWTAGATHTLTLNVSGTTITASIDGFSIVGTPLTNSAVTAAGQAGSRIYAGATGTNFYVQ